MKKSRRADLRRPSQFEQLEIRQLLIGSDWTNVLNPLNTTADENGLVAPNDVLVVVNELNARRVSDPRTGELPVVGEGGFAPPPFHDVNCDSLVAPNDVLEIINFINGARPRPGWFFGQVGGADEGLGSFSSDACAVRLHEGNSLVTSLTASFTVPEGATGVSFEFENLSFDETSEGSVHDAFEAALVDTSGRAAVHPLSIGGDAYFNVSEGFSSVTTADAVHTAERVTLSLADVLPGSEVQLIARLVNNDGDTESTVLVRSVEIEFGPAGAGEAEGNEHVGARSTSSIAHGLPVERLAEHFHDGVSDPASPTWVPSEGAIPGRAPSRATPTVRQDSGPTFESAVRADGESGASLIDSRGREFWIGFPDNRHEGNNTPQKALHITGDVSTVGVVEVPGLVDPETSQPFRVEFAVNPGEVTAVELPSEDAGDAIDDQTDFDVEAERIAEVQQRGVHIVAEAPITVYGISRAVNTTDAFLALPLDSLGTEHITLGYENTFYLNRATQGTQFLVVGTEDDTQVDITPGSQTFSTSDSQATIFQPSSSVGFQDAGGRDIGPTLLTESGEYTLTVQPPLDGYAGTYRFELMDFETAAEAVDFSESVTARFPTGREARVFKFDVETGQRIYFDYFAATGVPKVELFTPSGRQIVQNIASDGNPLTLNGPTSLSEPGTHYLLMVGEEDQAFDTSFRLMDVSAVPTLELNTDVVQAFDEPGQANLYQFVGTAGQRLLFDSFSSDRNVHMTLFGPGGNVALFRTATDDQELTLAEEGTYHLLAFASGSSTASYGFRLIDFADAPRLPIGTPNDESYADGKVQIYRFDAGPAQTAQIDIQSSTNPFRTNVEVFDPAGRRVGSSVNSGSFEALLSIAGTYRLVVRGTSVTDIGDITQQVSIRDDASVQKTGFNSTQTLSIGPGEEASFQFSAPAGTPFLVDSLDPLAENLNVELTDPSGVRIFTGIFAAPEQSDIPRSAVASTLPVSGTYTITLRGNSATDAGDYPFRVLDLDSFATALPLDTIVSGSLPTGRESLAFTFDATAGEQYNFNGLAASSTSTFVTRILDEHLQSVFPVSALGASPNADGLFQIANGGRHYVVLQGARDGAVDYNFQVQKVSAAPTVNLGETIQGEISLARTQQHYRIALTAGQQLFVDSLDGRGNLVIRRPGGTAFYSSSGPHGDSNEFQNLVVPETGEYLITVEENVETNYAFRILQVDAAPMLDLDTDMDVVLPSGLESQFFRIDSEAAQTLTFDSVDSTAAVAWRFYDPSGRVVGSDNIGRDFTSRTLVDGNYYLGVIGRGGTPGGVTFRASRAVDPPAAVAGFNTEIALEVPIRGQTSHTFTTPAGRPVFLNVMESRFGIPAHSVTLDQGETYLIRDLRGANFGFAPDLTGSTIISDKPVAVFGGNRSSFVPTTFFAADHLVEQIPATNTWGREFVTVPLETGTTVGERFRFLAQVDGTEVSVNGEVVATLDRGDFHEQVIAEPAHIEANGPILVAQFGHSQSFYRQPTGGDPQFLGDPLMLLVPPAEQFLSNYTVSTPAEDSIPETERFDRNFVNLLVPTEVVGQLEIDGVAVDATDFTPIGDSQFSGAQVPIELGSYELTSPLPFGVFVYGFGSFDSYGYTGGQALTPVADVASVVLTPETASPQLNGSLVFTARIADEQGAPIDGIRVDFDVAGVNPRRNFGFSNDEGLVQFSYAGNVPGRDVVTASVGETLDDSIIDWLTDAAPPQIDVSAPRDGSSVPAGTTLVATGFAMADFPDATLDLVTVNGVPLESVDAAGNFFVSLFIGPGDNEYEFVALDSSSQIASQTITIRGAQPSPSEVEFSQFADVTGSFQVAFARSSYHQQRKEFYAETAVENTGQFAADVPLLVGITNISDPMVLVRGADGTTPEGVPYYDFTGLVSGGTLNPRGQTGVLSAAFYNPNETQFDFDLVFFAKLNEPPEFKSLPPTRADVNREYFYQVQAADPNGETISFELLESPASMTIDADTGLIRWTPAAGDTGVHPVEVRASDQRLGASAQRFVVTVRSAEANRVPVFASLPGTLAEVGVDYPYVAQAVDADADPVSYGVVSGPAGLTVDAGSGQVDWIPLPSQLGQHEVVIEATDGRGGSSQQSFSVLAVSPPENHAPVIVSRPPLASKQGPFSYQLVAHDGDEESLTYFLQDGPEGMNVDENGLVAWSSTSSELGPHPVIVGVVDERGGVDRQAFTLTVFDNQAPSIDSQAVVSAEVGVPYSYQMVVNDSVDTVFSFEFLSAPVGMTIDGASGLVSWDVTESAYEREHVSVRVADGRGGMAEQEFTINVDGGQSLASNKPPSFVSSPPSVASVGTTFRYPVMARDPNGDAITFDLPLAPEGMVIDPMTGRLGWYPAPEQAGLQHVVVRANDGNGGVWLQSFQVEVDAANTAPVVTSSPAATATVGTTWEYRIRVQDAENDPVTIELVEPVAGVSITSLVEADATAVLSFTPAVTGTQEMLIAVRDGHGGTAQQQVSIEVVGASANVPPVIESEPRPTISAGAPWVYLVAASDPNGDPLTVALTDGPTGMVLDANARIVSWEPTIEQLGTHEVTLTVADSRGVSADQRFDVAVTSISENAAPQIVSPPSAFRATVGQPFAYDLRAADGDADPVEWTLVEAPSGASLDRRLGTLRWTPSLTHIGSQRFIISAMDPGGEEATQSFSLIVSGANLIPMILSSAPAEAVAGRRYVYGVRGIDPENDTLRYTLSSAPPGMSIDAARGVVRWTPTADQLGVATATVGAIDSHGNATSQSFSIQVSEEVQNQPPVITSRAVFRARVDARYEYDVEAIDAEGDTVTFSLIDAPSGMLIDSVTGLITWTASSDQAGAHLVRVSAEDGEGNQSVQRFAVLARVNQAPVITSEAPVRVSLGGIYRYDILVDDPEGDAIGFNLLSGPTGMMMDSHGRIRWETTPGAAPTSEVMIQVTDSFGASVEQSYNLEVTPDTMAPRVELQLSANPLALGQDAVVVVLATDDVGLADLTLSKDGVPIVLDANLAATIHGDVAGQFTLSATATDHSGNETSVESVLRVFDPSDTEGPVIQITAPAPNSVVTAMTDVIGSITDDNLLSYRIDFGRSDLVDVNQPEADDLDYQTLAEGSTPAVDEVLATFDPTLLINDDYVIRVLAEDASGNVSAETLPVGLDGRLKLGEFAVDFTDLSIPVAGIPITVTRSYDTRNANEREDFGFGWSLSVADPQLRETIPVNELERQGHFFAATPFREGTRVYLTNPEGRRIGFTFQPQRQFSIFGGGSFSATFVPDPGVYDTLDVGSPQLRLVNGAFHNGFDGSPFNPSAYRLTTREGDVYEYGQFSGLDNIQDRNGNRLEIRPDGIFSSLGPSIEFVRDPQGRIAEILDTAGSRLRYRYDVDGNLVEFSDREGQTTRYGYRVEPAHFLDSIEDPRGEEVLKLEFDAEGRLLGTLDALGNRVRQSAGDDRLTYRTIDARGNATRFLTDERGNILEEIDALANTTRFEYGDSQNPDLVTRMVDRLGNDTHFSYDAQGNRIGFVDAVGNTRTITYDAFARQTSRTDELGRDTAATYDQRGNATGIIDAAGNSIAYTYDAQGRIATITNVDGLTTTFGYADAASPTRIQVGNEITTVEYDSLEQPIVTIDESGAIARAEFDRQGRTIRQVGAQGEETLFTYSGTLLSERRERLDESTFLRSSFEYDEAGRLVRQVDAEGGAISFEYDANGNRTLVRDELGNETLFVYDALNRLVERVDARSGRQRYEYDAEGNVTAVVDRNGRRREFVYDFLGRIAQELWLSGGVPNKTIQFRYDAVGNTVNIEDGDSSVSFQYDVLDRAIVAESQGSVEAASLTLNYEYDASGNTLHVLDSSGTGVRSSFDDRGRAVTTTWTGTDINDARVEFSYGPNDRLASTRRYASATSDALVGTSGFSYDDNGRITSIVHRDSTDAVLVDYGYSYDLLGRLASESHHGNTTAYSYDPLGQLTGADHSSLPDEGYEYDEVGNRRSSHRHGRDYSTETGNLLSSDGTFSYEYDGEGNLVRRVELSSGEVTSFVYDYRNRVTEVVRESSGGITYTYDVLGRRTSKTVSGVTTYYTYDRQNVWADLDSEGEVIARYLHGRGVDELIARYRPAEGTAWYLVDRLGSVRDVANSDGEIVNHIDYDSFGNILSQSNAAAADRFNFTGREFDSETGLYYYRARYYDSDRGRFLSQDPLGFRAGDINLYRYVGNSPNNFVDPSGMAAFNERAAVDLFNQLLLNVGVPAAGRVAAAAICKGAPLEREEVVDAIFGAGGQDQAAATGIGTIGVKFFVPKAAVSKALAKALGIVSLAGTVAQVGGAIARCAFPQILVGIQADFAEFGEQLQDLAEPFNQQGPAGQVAQGQRNRPPFGGPFPE